MSGVAIPTESDHTLNDAVRLSRKLWRAVRWSAIATARLLWLLLAAPYRALSGFRRILTPASTTLLLISIVGLNIIWGYPWLGIFSVSVSMMSLGFLVSRVFRPQLRLGVAIPVHAPAGVPFSVQILVRNAGRLPGLELFLRFAARNSVSFRETQPVHFVDYLRSQSRTRLATTAVIERRGVHALPDVIVESLFPFHLFRSTRRVATESQIAITPRPLDASESIDTQNLALSIIGFAKKQTAGESMEYTGSREYVPGMPVQRWDFASWARLGRPIVREFSSPAIQSVIVVVDTAASTLSQPQRKSHQRAESINHQQTLERILSTATTAIIELTKCNVRVRMVLTSETDASDLATGTAFTAACASDLLVRLAAAKFVDAAIADDRIETRLSSERNTPVLVLSGRQATDQSNTLSKCTTWIRIDAPSVPDTGPTLRTTVGARQDSKQSYDSSKSPTRVNLRGPS